MKRPRIKTLEICDFRAFPGPAPVTIELGGKNLFLYGENGVGKSSVFQALDGMFAVNWTPEENADELERQANRFTGADHKGTARVSITYDDGKDAAIWSAAGHPIDTDKGRAADARIVNAAWAKAILDYRSLLATNYDHDDEEVNLFDVCVDHLLRDYVTVTGDRLGDIWKRLTDMLELPQIGKSQQQKINDDSRLFNDGLEEAVKAVLPLIDPFLDGLGYPEIRVTALTPSRIAYNNSKLKDYRDYDDCSVIPQISYRGEHVNFPQLFLNEARLSALALAIYFAGRKLAEKQPKDDMPRIMVLDDILIGLDQANRVPVLDVCSDHFQDWQVIILTHDRMWFDIGRQFLRHGRADEYWTFWQLHQPEGNEVAHLYAPKAAEVGSSVAVEALNDARKFLQAGHSHAAGNAARLATEFALREFCAKKNVYVPYVPAPNFLPASKFLECIEAFDTEKHYQSVIASIRMYTTILLNPLSHGGTPEVNRCEILGAIEVVDKLLFSLRVLPTADLKNRKPEAK